MSTSTDETYSGAGGGQSDWGSEDSDSGILSTSNDSDDSYSVSSSSFSSSLSSSVSLGENRRRDCERCENRCCGDCQPKSCILPSNRPPCCKTQCRPVLKKDCCPCPKRMSCASSCAPALTYAQTLLLIKESQARLQSQQQQQQCCSTCAPVAPVAPCAQPATTRQQLTARAHCPVYSSQPLACPQPVPPAPQPCCPPAPPLVCCAPAPAPPAPKPCCGCIIRAN
jgi:hypothetical protein